MRITTSVLATLFLLSGCVDDAPLDDGREPGEALRLGGGPATFGAFDRGKAWPYDTLQVCWHASASGPEFIQRRLLVQNTLTREWGKVGRIRFVFSFCDPLSTADIRIGHNDDESGFSELGTDARAVAPGAPTMIFSLRGPPPGGCAQLPPTQPGDPTVPIARCDGLDTHNAPPPSDDVWVAATALHEMGHALGLRHEHARPDSTCIVTNEPLDLPGHDGEAIWPFDASSVMSYCALGLMSYDPMMGTPRISAGDIRALHTLYPGTVGLFPDPQLAGTTLWIGPGYYTRTTTTSLATVSSLVVPPGFRVVACSASTCQAFTESVRTLPAGLDNGLQNILVSATASVHRDTGYRGAMQQVTGGLYRASQGQLATVGDDQISSAWVPPTSSVTLCTDDDLAGACVNLTGGRLGTSGYALNLDDQTSSVQVSPRVVTYSDRNYRGDSWSLGLGTYRASAGSPFLLTVRALAVPGLKVTACTAEGTCSPAFGCGGAGTCVTTEGNSLEWTNSNPIRFLKISTPLVVSG